MNHHDLEDALNFWRTEIELDAFDVVPQERFLVLMDAARLVERLLPGVCGNCNGLGLRAYTSARTLETGGSELIACKPCHGIGRVWDEGTVEAVAKVIYDGDKANLHKDDPFVAWDLVILERHRSPWHKQARAVLSALVELL